MPPISRSTTVYPNQKTMKLVGYTSKGRLSRVQAISKLRSSPKFMSAVRKEIRRFAEKKVAISNLNNVAVNVVSGILTTPTQVYLLPQITQGNTLSTRVGNKIQITKIYLQCMLNCLPYSSTTNPSQYPFWVKYWVLKNKKTQKYNAITNTDLSGFFENGTTNSNFSGLPADLMKDVAPESWRVFKTGMKLMDFANTSGVGLVANAFPTNDAVYQWCFNIDVTKYVKRNIIFEDIADNVPCNDNLFIMFQAVNADGSASSGEIPVELHYHYRCDFVDV